MKRKQVIGMAFSLLPAAIMAQELNLTPAQQTLVAEIPTSSAQRSREIFTALDKDADKLVPLFASQLTTQKSDADTTSRYSLGGLVWTTGHSGTAKQKEELARLLADAIGKTEGVEPKSFLIEQLQFLGIDSIAPTLYPLMTDNELGPRAIRTLASLKPKGLAGKVKTALADAKTTDVKAGLLLTLARLAPSDGAAAVAPYASDENIYVRTAALDALAAIGDPKSRPALKAAIEQSTTFQDLLAPARYLSYARRLALQGRASIAAEICREVLTMDHPPETSYLRGTALTVLAEVSGEKSLDTLFEYIRVDEEDIRATALAAINRFKSSAVSQRLTKALKESPDPEVTGAILLALGDRKDVSVLPAIAPFFKDADTTTAQTAVAAAGEIDRAKALKAYTEALKEVTDPKVAEAIIDQLRRVKSDQLLPAIAAAYPSASADNQALLIKLIGDRRASSQKQIVYEATKSENQAIRSAAYDALGRVAQAEDLPRLRDMMLSASKSSDRTSARKALVAAARESTDEEGRAKLLIDSYNTADDKGKVALLETMSAIADIGTLEFVSIAANSAPTDELKDEAMRALSEWQSADAHSFLQQVASTSKNPKHKVLAVRGITRLAGTIENKQEKAIALIGALKLASRPDEQREIISLLSDIRTTDSLKALAPFVTRDEVKAEAMEAAVKIALPDPDKKYAGISGPETLDILTRGVSSIADDAKRKPVEKYIYSLIREVYAEPLAQDAEGFSLLFNGKDLTGWIGDTDGYGVENGILYCKAESGGKLYTAREYGDFVMRFEFRLPHGANNGVGIRTPTGGDPAYDGMEIQILDDHDERYKDIKDWQRHGSVYGIQAAKPTELKFGEEWNVEEISCIGRNIKVTVNGNVITEVNLDEAKAKGYPSDKPHPGADRNNGHIAFLGHGHKVEFRNVRIKNVTNTPPEGFTNLFDGKDLDGWKGLVANPIKRKEMDAAKLAEAQQKADKEMAAHWAVQDGVLFFDGEGSHLCTTKDYANFEMHVDWCIPAGGDNGIYLRGTPQVQIWDPHYWPQGSGGLYNNQKGTSDPLTLADNPIGQWNTFQIKMVDDKVTVTLNNKLVVDDEVLENYWDRKQPIFPKEQLELQSHGSPAWFRNVYIKELP